MTGLVPSFLSKLDRAEKHLVDLDDAILGWSAPRGLPHPYAARKGVEGNNKREVYRLRFTRSPANTDIPLIAADAIYNMRSSLEHLIGALAPAGGRDKLTFPIFWRGVWEPDDERDDFRRHKQRHVWRLLDKALAPEAITVLKRLQPPDDGGPDEEDHGLRILNQLSNSDRHTKLPVAAAGIRTMQIRWRMPDGSEKWGLSEADPGAFVEDGAEITDVPEGAVYMEAQGTPVVAIRLREKGVASHGKSINVELPGGVRVLLDFLRDSVVPRLLPYVHGPR